jgi:hypothetical protein
LDDVDERQHFGHPPPRFFKLMAKLAAVTGTNLQGYPRPPKGMPAALGGAPGWTIGLISEV